MTYKAIVVDDEPRARKGIATMLEASDSSWEIVAFCKDGAEALEYVKSTPDLDLIITDIRMPKLEGIPLISSVRKINPGVEIIIISGFSEFQYAQQAIKLRVNNYILKPIVEEEFYSTIKKVTDILRIKKNQADSVDLIKYRNLIFTETVDLIKTDNLIQLFNASGSSFDSFHLLIFEFDSDWLKKNCDRLQFAVKNLFTCYDFKVLIDEAHIYCYKNTFLCFLISARNINLDQLKNAVQKTILEIFHKHKLSCSAGISFCEKAVDIPHAFACALSALKQNIYSNDNAVYVANFNNPTSQLSFPFRLMDKIDNSMSVLDFSAASELLNNILNVIYYMKPDYQTLQKWILQILEVIKKHATHYQVNPKLYSDFYDKLSTILYYRHFSSIRHDMEQLLASIVSVIEKTNETKQNKRVQKILFYLNENYTRDVSLDELSEKFGFNTSYISSLFKSETGINITDYLSNLRIDKAKDLLISTDMKINEIAHSLGYNNVNYFHRIFKKTIGITPIEYRRLRLHS
jgi:two-component system response regulator YesN